MLKSLKKPKFKAPKELRSDWSDFSGGLNTLLRQTELKGNELCQMDNMMLKGKGVPTKRWGSQDYFMAAPSPNHSGRGVFSAKKSDGTKQLLAITDWGYLVNKSGASYTTLTGTSWASGYNVEFTQLNDNVYGVSESRELVKYDFSTLTGFPTLSRPSNVQVSNMSGATGSTTWSWRIAAVSKVGETLGSTYVSMASLPQDLADTTMRIGWDTVSAASGDLVGYNIYRGHIGDETWLATVDDDTTTYFDIGKDASPLKTAPTADTTGGPNAKYIIRYQDRLILAGIENEPSKVLISGRVPYHERFELSGGGGYALIDPDSGDDITGLAVHSGRIIVFKENSVWELTIGTISAGNYQLLNPSYQLITHSQGCSSHRSITPVENDLFFANKEGVYVIGHEPQYAIDVLRTNELSVKIRPFFEGISKSDFEECAGIYYKHKYVLTFPNANKMIVYDRERACWVGPWSLDFGINQLAKYEDSNGISRLVAVDAYDNYVSEFRGGLNSDKGTAFRTRLKTKKEAFGDWSIFKTINDVYLYLTQVIGDVDVKIFLEERDGLTNTAKSFDITSTKGVSGFGTDQFGDFQIGLSKNDAALASEDTIRVSQLYKTARTAQIELTTFNARDDYELLGMKMNATPQGKGSFPSDWRV